MIVNIPEIKTYKAKDWRDAESIYHILSNRPAGGGKERRQTMLEPIIYCAKMMNDHMARVPFCPKLLKKIWAMGCPRLPFITPSGSWPMQNARATFTAALYRI